MRSFATVGEALVGTLTFSSEYLCTPPTPLPSSSSQLNNSAEDQKRSSKWMQETFTVSHSHGDALHGFGEKTPRGLNPKGR